MELSLLFEYGWVLLVLIALEGILAADNALVLAIMVKHLPEQDRKKALFYGLAGAFIFRFGSLFIISFLVNVWQVQAIGAIYLLFISLNHLIRKYVHHRMKKTDGEAEQENEQHQSKEQKKSKGSGFWTTVLKVEVADIAFAVDSILAAVALAMTLPNTTLPKIGGLDGGKFIVILLGGLIGVIIMRFAATFFVKLLNQRPGLEVAAFMIVGWVGVKLVILTISHPEIGWIAEEFSHSMLFKAMFYIVLITIAVCGWFLSSKKEEDTKTNEPVNDSVSHTQGQ